MELREVEGKDMRDALERTRDALGEKAVVVSHRRAPDGRVVLAVSKEVPRSVQALSAMRAEARSILARNSADVTRRRPVGLQDVERRMRMSGCSAELTERVMAGVMARLEEARHPLDVAADVIGAAFQVATARPQAGVTPVMAFVGPTGVGKTTSAAKLARCLQRAGRRVALATLDTGKPVESLRAYADLLRVPYLDVRAGGWAQAAGAHDALLLDTSGDVKRDVERLERLGTEFETRELGLRLDAYLVLAATSSVAALEQLVQTTATLRPAGCVITKLDEVPLRAPVLELALRLELPIAFLSDGASYRGRFHRAAAERFADLCLRGSLS